MTPIVKVERVPGSFRDPDGFMFLRDGVLHRQVNVGYQADYDLLMGSGLYRDLVASGALIPHDEVDGTGMEAPDAYRILRPEAVPFISFPYEWCFSQLQDAALTTLDIQARAMERGMSLKDASAYNIQFRNSRPVLIDTLSFAAYREGEPWVAYRQFCQQFLAPLALMARVDTRLGRLSQLFLDGVPLDMASRLLPYRTLIKAGLLLHIHLHARSQAAFADRPSPAARARMGRRALTGLIDSLRGAVRGLSLPTLRSEWGGYYGSTSYDEVAMESKVGIVRAMLEKIRPRTLWDLGANTGRFSRVAASLGIPTLSFDLDHAAVEANYRECREAGEAGLLPLLLDVTNPSPAIGWANHERPSLSERGPANALMALALVHHLAISNNLPFDRIAEWFAATGARLIVEFIPKDDPQVRRLLRSRADIFPDYHEAGFSAAFGRHFRIQERRPVRESGRILFLMERLAP